MSKTSVLSQEPRQPPCYRRQHPGPHLLQGNAGQAAPVQGLCHVPKGSSAHHSLHFSSIYYKRRKLQLLSFVATSGFDKTWLFCFLQLVGKPGAAEPQPSFPSPFCLVLQGAVCSRQTLKSTWLSFALLSVSRGDLRNPSVWLPTSELRLQITPGSQCFFLSWCHDVLQSLGRAKHGIMN